jgi:hypothetical protein
MSSAFIFLICMTCITVVVMLYLAAQLTGTLF